MDIQTQDDLGGLIQSTSARIVINPLREESAVVPIYGTAPYLSNQFSAKAREKMREKQVMGSLQSRKKTARAPKDFNEEYLSRMHVSTEDWYGIPATAFICGMVDACRGAGYAMNRAKMFIKIIPDGFDRTDGQGLVRIYGKPRPFEMHGTLADKSTDIIVRARWDKWNAKPFIVWDADQFQASDICNLMSRVGKQVGIGAGRPFSKKSVGIGMGLFEVRA